MQVEPPSDPRSGALRTIRRWRLLAVLMVGLAAVACGFAAFVVVNRGPSPAAVAQLEARARAQGFADGEAEGQSATEERMSVELERAAEQARAEGTRQGYEEGRSDGETTGYREGYAAGEAAGSAAGYQDGYSQGFTDGQAVEPEMTMEERIWAYEDALMCAISPDQYWYRCLD